jgi:cryptochrome
MAKPANNSNSIYWFRKALRLHDNPALLFALENSQKCYPIFILDPWFVKNYKVGVNRWRFLIQSLNDLNESLMKLNSRLILVRGQPMQVFREKIKEWQIDLICFESDTEPYAKQRDSELLKLATELNVKVETKCSHTLYDPMYLFKRNNNKVSGTYQSFCDLLKRIGPPPKPVDEPKTPFQKLDIDFDLYKIPTLKELEVDESLCGPCLYPGGESEALKRMKMKMKNETWVSTFEKPNTSPNSLQPSTTVLSPYLKFGCLSARLFYWTLKDIFSRTKKYSQPPVSLEGQMYWREFFYFNGAHIPNFDRIEGNPICRQIQWDNNQEFFEAWRNSKTGYPFIDAIMTQLRDEGWIHHLARHAVACFLTRGDLYVSWTKGQEVFEEFLLDADWSLNAANWQWLSASAFFHQYFRVYSPIAFGKKTDKNGDYIRKYVPVLKNFPSQYIYEPWTAPLSVQKAAKCIIGQDYPRPIVDHNTISKTNINRMKQAYESSKAQSEESEEKTSKKTSAKSSPDNKPAAKRTKK